ncbi:MAG: peptidase lon domain protein [Variovorax sp.]|nr:peptidase lon domain protein [Variovorax sp.]
MTPPPLLHALPLFPLGTVLFPGGLLPLRIFEVRYLDMIGRCHKVGAPFGVVSLTRGNEVRVAGAEAESFAAVGTLAFIREFNVPQPGLVQIECLGAQRFRIEQSVRQKHGLWTAEAELLPDDLAVDVPDDLLPVAAALRQLVATLEQHRAEGRGELRLPLAEPLRYGDCGWLANRWCELLPMPVELRQRLMALDSPLMRLELVGDLLARADIVP